MWTVLRQIRCFVSPPEGKVLSSTAGPPIYKRQLVVAGEGPSLIKRRRVPTFSDESSTSPATRYCSGCDENVSRNCFVGHLRSNRHTRRYDVVDVGEGVAVLHSAFQSRIASYRVSSTNFHIIVVEFMAELKNKIINLIKGQMVKLKSLKFNLELFGYFYLETQDRHEFKNFITANEVVVRGTNLSELYIICRE